MILKTLPANERLITSGKVETIGQRLHDYQDIILSWIQDNLFELLAASAMAIFAYLLLSWLKRFAARKAQSSERPGELPAIVARTLARTGRFFRIMVAIELVNGYTKAPALLGTTIHALFTIAIVIQIAIWLREVILGLIERRAGDGEQGHDTLSSAMTIIRLLVSFALFAIASIIILDNLGVNITGLVAGLGVGGIAIGLAAQGIFADLFAAISIIFDKPFRRGDVVSYDNTVATVEKIGMKSTRLRALSGEEKIISNSKLLEKEITNATLTNYRRTTYILSLIYSTPVEKLHTLPGLMQEAVNQQGGEFVRCTFTGFGASSLDFQLLFDIHTQDMDHIFQTRHAIGLAVIAALARGGYDLAYPTQTTFTAAPDGTLVMPYAPLPHDRPGTRS